MEGVSFYNFPYTFGYLLSRSFLPMLKAQGRDFLPRYEEFLRRSGTGSCEEVVRKTLDRNIRDPAFWMEAIQSLEDTFAKARELLEVDEIG